MQKTWRNRVRRIGAFGMALMMGSALIMMPSVSAHAAQEEYDPFAAFEESEEQPSFEADFEPEFSTYEYTAPETDEEPGIGGPLDTEEEDGLYEAGGTSLVNTQNYDKWATPIWSYLVTEDDGSRMTVRYNTSGGSNVLEIKRFNYKLEQTESRKLSLEGSMFGGFYAGNSNYFVVTGNSNPSESNSTAVILVTKYSRNWEKQGTYTLYGGNTYMPFKAGTCRMTEAGGILYVDTCHEMYGSGGTHHQSNLLLAIQESSMTAVSERYGVESRSTGYVTHSFSQFIRVRDGVVYTADHGDGYPRAVTLSALQAGTAKSGIGNLNIVEIPGGIGANTTGLSLGGFELSGSNAITTYSAVDFSNPSATNFYSTRNIYVAVTPLGSIRGSAGSSSITKLTNYTGESAGTPHLVKISDDRFLLLWSMKDTTTQFQAVMLDGSGKKLTPIRSITGSLSDCQPVVNADGNVEWFTYDGSGSQLFSMNPDTLSVTKSSLGPFTLGFANDTGKYATLSATVAEPGTKVIITPRVPDQYLITSVSVASPSDNSVRVKVEDNGSYSIVMPSSDVTLTAEYQSRVQYVFISSYKSSVAVGDSYRFSTAVYPENAGNKDVSWTSSDPSVASVDTDGTVHGLKEGNVTITATSKDGGKTDSKSLKISLIHVSAMLLSYARYSSYTGRPVHLTATILPSNATNKALVWSSSDTSKATVDQDGLVRCLAEGVVTITATAADNGKARSCTLTIKKNPNTASRPSGQTSGTDQTSGSDQNSGQTPSQANLQGFNDVTNPKSWYYQPVYWAVENGITNGTSPGYFSPNAECTRGQAMTFLWKAMGSVMPVNAANFADVKAGAWYQNPVSWAVEKGITNGISATQFGPGNPCTRAQIVTFLWKAAGSPPADAGGQFSDVPAGKWYSQPVAWAVSRNITNGVGDGKFGTNNICTRAQIMTFLYKQMNGG